MTSTPLQGYWKILQALFMITKERRPPTRLHTDAGLRSLTNIQQRTPWSGLSEEKMQLTLERLEAPGREEVWWGRVEWDGDILLETGEVKWDEELLEGGPGGE